MAERHEARGRTSDEWRTRLLGARRRLGISREELAALAGISASTIRGYELGRRHPKQESLEAILRVLRLERTEANPIRQSAGFAPVESLWEDVPDYFYSVEELQRAVECVTWPQFVTNDAAEVVAANRAACAVWGMDFATERKRRTPIELNLLAVANERDFPEVVENWDDVLTTLAAVFKGRAEGPEEIGAPSPYLAQVLARFTENDHQFLTRLIAAWNRATPQPAKCRWTYRVMWNDPSCGRMAFHALVSVANEHAGLAFNDWIPLDSCSWDALNCLMRKRK